MNEHVGPAEGMQFPDDIVFQGHAAPVRIEGSVHDLEVVGAIPPELEGVYYRNSADHAYPPLHGRDIFLNGDGMVHMVRFERGHADLTTRYVRTRKFELERAARRALFGAYRNSFTDSSEVAGEDANTANTSVMWHHGKLYALKESGRPYELDPITWRLAGRATLAAS
nr:MULTISPECIES: carotenoid oxygenase family protein [unclassified Bradyrhizobium]